MRANPPSFSYFVMHGVSSGQAAKALTILYLKKARDRLGRQKKESEGKLQTWLPSLIGDKVQLKEFNSPKRLYFQAIVGSFLELTYEIENEFLASSDHTLEIELHDENSSMMLRHKEINWDFYKREATEFFEGDKRSLIHLAERGELQTVTELYTGFPLAQATKFMYIRQTSEKDIVSYAIGLFQVHDYLTEKKGKSGKFFTFLSSSRVSETNRRNLFVEVGDLISSGSVVSAITSHESDVIEHPDDLGSLVEKGKFDKPIFQTVDEIRAFNFKIVSSCCMRGVAFIKDHDLETAVTPCIAFPLEPYKKINLEFLRIAKSESEIIDVLKEYCAAKYLVASAKELNAYFKTRERIIIRDQVSA